MIFRFYISKSCKKTNDQLKLKTGLTKQASKMYRPV